jgi:hypothetical protein
MAEVKEASYFSTIISTNLKHIINDILPIMNSCYILSSNTTLLNNIRKHDEKYNMITISRGLHFGLDALHFNIKVKDVSNDLHVYVGLDYGIDSEYHFIPLLVTDLPYTLLSLYNEELMAKCMYDPVFLSSFLYDVSEGKMKLDDIIQFYIKSVDLYKDSLMHG